MESSNAMGTTMYRFQQRLKKIKTRQKIWNKEEFRNIHQAKKDLEQKMASIQHEMILHGRTDSLDAEESTTQQQLEERYAQEEILWKQKSRIQWLKERETNTAFFHRSMIQQRHMNIISKLYNSQGEILQSKQQIQEELINYFQDLLTKPGPDRRKAINKITQHIP